MFSKFWTYFLRKMRCQKGEAGLDIDDETGIDDTGGDTEGNEPDDPNVHIVSAPDEVDEDEDADDDDKPADLQVQFDELKGNFENQTKEFEDLKKKYETSEREKNFAFTELRKATKDKGKADESVEFTDAQLQQLLEEHRDDPPALLQIMRLVAQQTSKKDKADAINQVDISNKKKEMDALLHKTYPEITNEGSEFRQQVNQSKDFLGLEDHPYGDFFAVGAMVLHNLEGIIAHAKEEGKKLALDENAETNRKKNIKSNTLSSVKSNKSKKATSSSNIEKNIKQMNMSKSQAELYRKMMANKETVTVGG